MGVREGEVWSVPAAICVFFSSSCGTNGREELVNEARGRTRVPDGGGVGVVFFGGGAVEDGERALSLASKSSKLDEDEDVGRTGLLVVGWEE